MPDASPPIPGDVNRLRPRSFSVPARLVGYRPSSGTGASSPSPPSRSHGRRQKDAPAAVQVCTEAPVGGPAYRAASDVLEMLDGLAEALTGKRTALQDPPHSIG